MAPIKFEEHIKEQLEERRLKPSAAAWERISGQLDLQQGKKKSKHVLLMAIAASFIIGVGITAALLRDKSTTNDTLVEVSETQDLEEESIGNPILNGTKAIEIEVVQSEVQETIQEKASIKETIEQNKTKGIQQ